MFINTVENMIVAIKDPSKSVPIYRYIFCFISSRSGLADHPLAFQWKHNVIAVPCKKKGGFKVPGADKAVNSNEKPFSANGWVISTFSDMGMLILCLLSLGALTVSMCGGSGSFMQCAMETGRSCVMFESDGMLDS